MGELVEMGRNWSRSEWDCSSVEKGQRQWWVAGQIGASSSMENCVRRKEGCRSDWGFQQRGELCSKEGGLPVRLGQKAAWRNVFEGRRVAGQIGASSSVENCVRTAGNRGQM
ncbi:hypothetical protein Adt_22537 [Abeliophyllum distichum]|uniref:Uncharacterized protein n=1 Tax=Abeliophyllum distichum TaxID=126358 RepID=A0ABD1T2I5_9LAMI